MYIPTKLPGDPRLLALRTRCAVLVLMVPHSLHTPRWVIWLWMVIITLCVHTWGGRVLYKL